MRKTYIAPSILTVKKEDLSSVINQLLSLGIKYLHLDVMDGVFVNNISLGVEQVKEISKMHNIVNDVHIMVHNPKEVAKEYLDAGADILSFHLEAVSSKEEVIEIIDLIHSYNKLAGLVINPLTDVNELLPYLNKLDLVLIMSVQAGAGGQKFNPVAIKKIKFLREQIDKNNLNTLIEVDGGINDETILSVKEAGVDLIVCGSYLVSGNILERYKKLV